MGVPARGLVRLIAAVLPVTIACAPPQPASVTPVVTFVDEFDAPAGSPPDGRRWNLEVGDNADNRELQYYTDATANAAHDGRGNLVITANRENPADHECWYGRCEYTSARLNTSGKFSQTYGRFEVRLKMSAGRGTWPAFWLLGTTGSWPNGGEIDVMENVGSEPSTVHGTVHGPGYVGVRRLSRGHTITGAYADDFHVFAVDWTPEGISWSVDGAVYHQVVPADVRGHRWAFDDPFYLILNLAVGGVWPGDPDGDTSFPNTLTVDYVRVTALPEAGTA